MNRSADISGNLTESAFFSIVNGEILVWDAFQEALQAADMLVGVGRFIPLHFLVEGPMRLQELAERAHTKESAASRLVERMVKDGLVEKRRDASDGRAVLLHVTERGRRVESQGRAVFAECLDKLFGGFSESELRALMSLIARIGAEAGGRVAERQEGAVA